jgi:hypothetical protein
MRFLAPRTSCFAASLREIGSSHQIVKLRFSSMTAGPARLNRTLQSWGREHGRSRGPRQVRRRRKSLVREHLIRVYWRCPRSEGRWRANRVRTSPVAALSDVRCRFGVPGAFSFEGQRGRGAKGRFALVSGLGHMLSASPRSSCPSAPLPSASHGSRARPPLPTPPLQ